MLLLLFRYNKVVFDLVSRLGVWLIFDLFVVVAVMKKKGVDCDVIYIPPQLL